jgi:hypothetical protein
VRSDPLVASRAHLSELGTAPALVVLGGEPVHRLVVACRGQLLGETVAARASPSSPSVWPVLGPTVDRVADMEASAPRVMLCSLDRPIEGTVTRRRRG